MKPFKIKIEEQGKPKVHIDNVWSRAYSGLVVAEIDMHSKWCQVEFVSSDSDGKLSIGIETTSESSHLNDLKISDTTIISFVNHSSKHWSVFCAQCQRYTLRIVLMRKL